MCTHSTNRKVGLDWGDNTSLSCRHRDTLPSLARLSKRPDLRQPLVASGARTSGPVRVHACGCRGDPRCRRGGGPQAHHRSLRPSRWQPDLPGRAPTGPQAHRDTGGTTGRNHRASLQSGRGHLSTLLLACTKKRSRRENTSRLLLLSLG